jgi:hypothetical protein
MRQTSIARAPHVSGFLTGKFSENTDFLRNGHGPNLYFGKKVKEAVRKVEKLGFVAEGKSRTAQKEGNHSGPRRYTGVLGQDCGVSLDCPG